MFRRMLASTRYIILVAVLGAFIASLAVLVYGGIETLYLVGKMVSAGLEKGPDKELLVGFIEVIDLFLIGTVFYITALGLYELFIDDQVPTPAWLHIAHIDDLKGKLLSVMVVIMVVTFLGKLVKWDGETNLLGLGAAVALLIAALTYFLSQGHHHPKGE